MKVVLVIAPEDFRDEELFHTKEELEKVGIKTIIASKKTGKAVGMLGGIAEAEITLDQIKVPEFDGIIFVGGVGSATYFNDTTALNLAKDFFEKGKLVAAICIAPSILANSGILEGKKATSYPSEENNLKSKGAKYTGKGVEVDGKIVTGKGPQFAREFGKEIVKVLKG
ncbi:MAG: DJ-1/PfpI family protein [archaeon]